MIWLESTTSTIVEWHVGGHESTMFIERGVFEGGGVKTCFFLARSISLHGINADAVRVGEFKDVDLGVVILVSQVREIQER
jgi:hypothetical protein